ncbi:MAG: SpoIIE family protein phosphatase [Ilumatobacter sp.]|uniref:SpoIIE family protein phosphatase n=1 Tax=Ilumatobacter sp. TaxID=1967498 RepID=UPI003C757097
METIPREEPKLPLLTSQLAEEDSRLVARQIALMMKDGVVIQAEDGRIIWHNAIACRVLRMTPDQLMGKSSMDESWQSVRMDGTPLPGDQHPAMRAIATGRPVEHEIMGVQTGTLALCWVQVDSFPLDMSSGRLAVSVFTDITEQLANRRELESTLLHLQNSLIQTSLPDSETIKFAGAYRSVGMSRSLGGDFYGAYETSPRRHDFFIGDVCGHGIAAAALSTVARNALRAIGPLQSDPSAVLADLHRIVESDSPGRFLTALIARVEHTPSQSKLIASSGGHPLPILVRDGVATPVGRTGPLVGMLPNSDRPVFEVDLIPGDQVICYTDGLPDCVTPRLSEEELLLEIPIGLPIEECVETLRHLGPDLDAARGDDAAILAFEVR